MSGPSAFFVRVLYVVFLRGHPIYVFKSKEDADRYVSGFEDKSAYEVVEVEEVLGRELAVNYQTQIENLESHLKDLTAQRDDLLSDNLSLKKQMDAEACEQTLKAEALKAARERSAPKPAPDPVMGEQPSRQANTIDELCGQPPGTFKAFAAGMAAAEAHRPPGRDELDLMAKLMEEARCRLVEGLRPKQPARELFLRAEDRTDPTSTREVVLRLLLRSSGQIVATVDSTAKPGAAKPDA